MYIELDLMEHGHDRMIYIFLVLMYEYVYIHTVGAPITRQLRKIVN
jgi:hypothetical protein